MVSGSEVVSKSPTPAGKSAWQANRTQWLLWLALIGPAVFYLVVYSIPGHLDKGVIERRYGWQIWETMSHSLPEAAYPGLLSFAYWALIAVVVVSFLLLTWISLRLTGGGENAERLAMPQSDSDSIPAPD